ncbi:hypothetical protein BD309DRAFT_920275 [Dichomitus squalens]|uniref:Uncharacterized protein n=1 Tax=Dichomitus squalens TaxID=114155 RepID=A0A4Q9NVJ2_9APHY|nr:hypothetical protein BD309DRAFT_920275 [Dichomitus squalens]TBU61481.1 hypothetical protein BD310DRAFT_197279 [Dichomitus squalens]
MECRLRHPRPCRRKGPPTDEKFFGASRNFISAQEEAARRQRKRSREVTQVTERGVTGVDPPDVQEPGCFRFFASDSGSERLVTRL